MSNPGQLRIPIGPRLESAYAVHVVGDERSSNPVELGIKWLERFCEDPLRSDLADSLRADVVQTRVLVRPSAASAEARFLQQVRERGREPWRGDPLGEPPLKLFPSFRMGAEEERRYRAATHLVVVTAKYPFSDGELRQGVLGARAVANGVALHRGGVIRDLSIMARVIALEALEAPLRADGQLTLSDHITCQMSAGSRGGWLTTQGMQRFGLPNLEMREIPAGMSFLGVVMHAVARRFLQEALAAAEHKEAATGVAGGELVLPDALTVHGEDLVAAIGKEVPSLAQTRVRLWFEKDDGGERLLRVGPPRDFDGTAAEWYAPAAAEFLGAELQVAPPRKPGLFARLFGRRDQ